MDLNQRAGGTVNKRDPHEKSAHPLVTVGFNEMEPAVTCKINFMHHFMHILSNTYTLAFFNHAA